MVVYDLGGGTFDAAVLRRDGRGFRLAGPPEGIEHLGGIDFDEAVFRHVLGGAGRRGRGARDPEDPATATARRRLRRDCVWRRRRCVGATPRSWCRRCPASARSVRLTRAELE